jgi:hypothetical protein
MAGAAPVCTIAGPPTQRIFSPRALTSRICAATRRTSSAWGFSLDTALDMNWNSPEPGLAWATSATRFTRTPAAPHTIRSSADTSDIAMVRAEVVACSSSITTMPQSISELVTSIQRPWTRTWVSRLVVE